MRSPLTLPLVLSLLSTSTLAVEGGVALEWTEHPFLIESNCTGTLIAGKYILTAGHCGASVSAPFPRPVNLANGETIMPITRHSDVYDDISANGADFAIWELPANAPYNKAIFLSDLNNPTADVQLNDTVTFTGFGQDDNVPRLGSAENFVTYKTAKSFSYEDEIAHSVPGDSGAPVFNQAGFMIGVNYAGGGSQDPGTGRYDQVGVNLQFQPVKDYLLTTINRWHSVTELKLNGNTTIQVQSLHLNPTDMSVRWNDGSLTSGDVVITGGSCVTDGAMNAFELCELTIESQGKEGAIHLESDNTITINPVKEETPTPEPEPTPGDKKGDSGGGSMGIFSLLVLMLIGFRRLRQ